MKIFITKLHLPVEKQAYVSTHTLQGSQHHQPFFSVTLSSVAFTREVTVESHLSELQLSEHVGYPNAFSKATPTISGYFRRPKAVQMANIECFRARSTCCIAAEDTE